MSYQDISASLVRVARATDQMREAGLSDRAVEVLLVDLTGLSRKTVRQVLAALRRLPDTMLTSEHARAIRLREEVGGEVQRP